MYPPHALQNSFVWIYAFSPLSFWKLLPPLGLRPSGFSSSALWTGLIFLSDPPLGLEVPLFVGALVGIHRNSQACSGFHRCFRNRQRSLA